MKRVLIVFAMLLFGQVFAQEMEAVNFEEDKKLAKTAKKEWKVGDIYFNMFNYDKALEHYLKANDIYEFDALLNYKIGAVYMHTADYNQSVNFFLKAKRLNPLVDLDILNNTLLRQTGNYGVDYSLANYYASILDLERAIEKFDDFEFEIGQSIFSEVADLNEVMKMVDKRKRECENAEKLIQDPIAVKIEALDNNVNSSFHDFGPVITADESVMYFTSNRTGYWEGTADNYSDIFVSYNEEGKWSKAENIGTPINTEGQDATIGLSVDGQKLYLYKSENRDIYISKLNGNVWEEPRPASKKINTGAWESSICFSPDEKTVYFVSDIGGGLGGKDIYYSTLDPNSGKWSDAKNIGDVVNTMYDEDFVFIHPDGKTMYFSSKGHFNIGGYDIFKTVYEDGKWSVPENLGYPLNTPGDEVTFVLAADGDRGYYASDNRGGLGGWDVMTVHFLENKKENQLVLLKGTIMDKDSNKPLEATITVTDNEKNETVGQYASNKITGKFLLALPAGKNYGLAIEKYDYLFHSENFIVKEDDNFKEFTTEVSLQKIVEGSTVILNNIFFKTNSSAVAEESMHELEKLTKLLNDMPGLRIELGGHTDNVGSAAFNDKLSEKRAKSVYDQLVKLGAPKIQMEYVGYGFKNPIASNDTEEGRAKNRRLEVKVIKK